MREFEIVLEEKLIEQLNIQGYERVTINDKTQLEENFKIQLSKHNKIEFSDEEFEKILIHLNGGTIFDKAKKLRSRFELHRDNKEVRYIEFLNTKKLCQNEFQITNQIIFEEKHINRYDVTVLINGLPLVQIELKRPEIELKEAFNQVSRYQKLSYSGLFGYIQLFVISNGADTKYYSNNKEQSFNRTFYWTDVDNNKHNQLDKFVEIFMEKRHIVKMISKYIVINESDKTLMVLRPYQYFAVEKILNRLKKESLKNGYIYHTVGSGKTLTSFKASQLLTQNDSVDKVIFAVDRKDLDYQRIENLKVFDKKFMDEIDNVDHLLTQITDTKTKLIITTIQKLNNIVSEGHLQNKMEVSKDKKIIFIFDECYKSEFGNTYSKVNEFFTNKQMIEFTGTPTFADNVVKNKDTSNLFNECLHKYEIKDAIEDNNVLGFSVEYHNTFKSKQLQDEEKNDLPIEEINMKEVFEAPERLDMIADFIISNHSKKTYAKEFNSIFTINSIDALIKYYDLFKSKKHNLNIAAIFTCQPNEKAKNNLDTKNKLDEIVKDYNKTFGANHNLDKRNGFDDYYIDVSKRLKNKQIDILLVVNMFLTGFDSKILNTVYVDKDLKHYELIQAFSRTNRILNEKKKHGNIVCFRNLKKRTNESIKLVSNKGTLETVLMKEYVEYIEDFNKYVKKLYKLVPTAEFIDHLYAEEEKVNFIEDFRNLLRVMNRLVTFSEFSHDELDMTIQKFKNYKSKYLNIYDNVMSKRLNTIYIDKKLKYQATSRTNRTLNGNKKSENIICDNNLREGTLETVLMKGYKEYVGDFNKYVEKLHRLAPTVEFVDHLSGKAEKAEFIEYYSNLLSVMNKLTSFSEFSHDELDMTIQKFKNYKRKYLNLYSKVMSKVKIEKVSILDEVDFEIELIRKSDININYIMMLLNELDSTKESYVKNIEFILKTIEDSEELRSKKLLIEKFINESITNIPDGKDLETEFEEFLITERTKAIAKFVKKEELYEDKVEETMTKYIFTKKININDIKKIFKGKPKLREKRIKILMVENGIKSIVEVFNW